MLVTVYNLFQTVIICAILNPSQSTKHEITVDLTNGVHRVSEKYLSVAFGSGLLQEHWSHFDFSSARIFTLARGLAPAYVRFGGTAECWLHYIDKHNQNLPLHKNFTDFNITSDDLDKIHLIASKAGWKVVFGLNMCLRTKDGTWNYSNPLQIIQYVASKGYDFGWELGNEPNHLGKFKRFVEPEVLGEDFVTLRTLLDDYKTYGDVLVGPDITRPKNQSMDFLKRFLSVALDVVDAITWHQYYVNKKTCELQDFYDPEIFDYLLHQLQIIDGVLSKAAPNKRHWMGETATAVGGGAPGLSNTYVATLSWLDKLGLAARLGAEVVMKQTFFHGSYALVDDDLNPMPNYWLSLLHKRLVGQTVLDVKDGLQEGRIVRVYAHCTDTKTGKYGKGAVTIMAINLNPSQEAVLSLSEPLGGLSVDQYILTPGELTSQSGDLTSTFILLNGVELDMPDDDTLPELRPVTMDTGHHLHIPSLALGFFVVPQAQAKACTDVSYR